MTIDLTPNNQQIKPENMAKYPDHKEWPYESLRTITEEISPSTTGDPYDAVYGDPIEHNIEIYKHDIATGLTADIELDDFEAWIPEFYTSENRGTKGKTFIHAIRISAIKHSKENQQLAEKLLAENKIKVPPQYQYYNVYDTFGRTPDVGIPNLDIRLKFESKEDADAWKIAKMKETQ